MQPVAKKSNLARKNLKADSRVSQDIKLPAELKVPKGEPDAIAPIKKEAALNVRCCGNHLTSSPYQC